MAVGPVWDRTPMRSSLVALLVNRTQNRLGNNYSDNSTSRYFPRF